MAQKWVENVHIFLKDRIVILFSDISSLSDNMLVTCGLSFEIQLPFPLRSNSSIVFHLVINDWKI